MLSFLIGIADNPTRHHYTPRPPRQPVAGDDVEQDRELEEIRQAMREIDYEVQFPPLDPLILAAAS